MKPVISSILAFLLFLGCFAQAPFAYSNPKDKSNQSGDEKDEATIQTNLFLAEELTKLISQHEGSDLLVVDSNLKPILNVKSKASTGSSEKIRFESMYDGENNEISVDEYNDIITKLLRGNNISDYSSDTVASLIALSIDTQTHNEDKDTNYGSDVQSVVWVRSELLNLLYKEIEKPMKNADHIFRALSRNDGAVLLNAKQQLKDQTLNLISLAIMYDRIRRHEIMAKSENKKNLYGRIANILRQRIRSGFEGLSKLSADSGYNEYYDKKFLGVDVSVINRRLGAVRLAKYFWISLMAPQRVVMKTIAENREVRMKKSRQSYGEKFVGFIKSFSQKNKELEIKDFYDQAFDSNLSEEQIKSFEHLSELMKPFEEKVAKTKLSKRLGRVLLSGLVGAMAGGIFNRPISDAMASTEAGESLLELTESFGDWLSVTVQWVTSHMPWVTGYYPDLTMSTMAIDMGVGTMLAYMMYKGLVNLSKHVSTRDFFTDQSLNRKTLLYKILIEHKVIKGKVSTCASQLLEAQSSPKEEK